MSLYCQQCKEPLQLDESLIDLSPSAYDMITGSLPSPSSSSQHRLSDAEKLAKLSALPGVKAAWQRAQQNRISTLPPLAEGTQPQDSSHTAPLPNESFVLLKDSVINTIPSNPPPPSSPVNARATRRLSGVSLRRASTPSKQQGPQSPSTSQPPPTESEPPISASPISDRLRSSVRLLNLLSANTDIDHPLCAECTHILETTLQRQLDETKRERDGYLAFEKEVRKERERENNRSVLSAEEAEKRIAALHEEELRAIEELKEAEKEQEGLDEELKRLEEEERLLEIEEAEFWQKHNAQMIVLEEQESQLASLRAAIAADTRTLEKLERTNVYNDAFCIGHDGVFGTINGLRLGRVQGVPVEWTEINAAWGQTLLLLYTIARKVDYTFENYRPIPMGSFSRIERVGGDKAVYELYGSGDLHVGRFLHNRRFDFAMVAFLDCLRHLMEWVKAQDPSIEFPHAIVKDKIGDASIKLQFGQDDVWTRSLRQVLLALKIILKWATSGEHI